MNSGAMTALALMKDSSATETTIAMISLMNITAVSACVSLVPVKNFHRNFLLLGKLANIDAVCVYGRGGCK